MALKHQVREVVKGMQGISEEAKFNLGLLFEAFAEIEDTNPESNTSGSPYLPDEAFPVTKRDMLYGYFVLSLWFLGYLVAGYIDKF